MYSFLYQLIYLPSYQPICLRIYRLMGLRSRAPSYLPNLDTCQFYHICSPASLLTSFPS